MTDSDLKIDFPVVGIGASAGGLEALRDFVKEIPDNSGMAFVIVQHLSADHPSIMDQLLASHTQVAVEKITDAHVIAPDTVYVIPAGPSVTIENGAFHLHERKDQPGVRTPIDEFFTSLAKECGRSAMCVVLSGTGSDGTSGVRAIKAAGGFAIVQESDSARFPGMPDSAVATGLVDFVLKAEAIPARLQEITDHRREMDRGPQSKKIRADIEEALPQIIELIDEKDGHDFSHYKTGTLIRRIERRMTLLRDQTVAGFIGRLESSPDERARLLHDFLIGVTEFFRDTDAFTVLEQEIISRIVNSDQGRIRIWVPGCSTGEEAYSIAMLVTEAMSATGDKRPCQIFGTDIDGAALSHARSGIYSSSHVTGVSDKRLERFFTKVDSGYQVGADLRERCVFAPHNLLQDPPFSRLDLISCRNLLIYLTPEIQQTVIPRFHYALQSGGFLFLGPSETLGKQDKFFKPLNRDMRLFQRNDEEPPSYTSLATAQQDTARRGQRIRAQMPARQPNPIIEQDFEQQVTNFYLRESAQPFAVISGEDDIVYLSERMGEFIRPPMGAVSSALDNFLARELRLPVRTAINDARESGVRTSVENIIVQTGENAGLYDIAVSPLPFSQGSLMLTLSPVRMQNPVDLEMSAQQRDLAERDMVDRELALTRQQLSATLSDYETTEQELRSTNEELLSMNEELQSSNEELETSREELQSINEELETINAELSENNRQLIEANSDLRNLFESTDIATVFLDQNLMVRRYTPTARELFGIQDRDIGRSINDLKWKISYDHLDEDAESVAKTLNTVEREVRVEVTGQTFLVRVRPYRRTDDRIDGCVITLLEITERKRNETQLLSNARLLEEQYAELETLYDTTPVGLCLIDKDLKYVRINPRLAEINGFPPEDHIGKTLQDLIPEVAAEIEEIYMRIFKTGEASLGVEIDNVTPAAPGQLRSWIVDYYPVMRDGEVFAVGTCVVEVTEKKAAERELEYALASAKESEAKMRRVFDQAPTMIAMHEGPEHRYIFSNPTHQEATGNRDVIGKTVLQAFPELANQNIVERYDHVFSTGEPLKIDAFKATLQTPDGPVERWYSHYLQPWYDGEGNVAGTISFAVDIHDRVETNIQLGESKRVLELALQAGNMGFYQIDIPTQRAVIDETLRGILGLDADQSEITVPEFDELVHPDDRERMQPDREEAHQSGNVELEFRIVRPDGDLRWVQSIGDIHFQNDEPTMAVGLMLDITDAKKEADQQNLLLHELQHRVKNTLATVLAIVQFSAKRANNVDAFTKTLRERLQAIARTHDLLTGSNWDGAKLSEVVRRELQPFAGRDGRRVRFEGADAMLSSKQMLSLTLAIHELTTNAAKYGALSADDGLLTITATKLPGNALKVVWEESGGPKVTPPDQGDAGFGSFLLQKIVGADLEGKSTIVYAETGVVWEIEFPLD